MPIILIYENSDRDGLTFVFLTELALWSYIHNTIQFTHLKC